MLITLYLVIALACAFRGTLCLMLELTSMSLTVWVS